MAEPRDWTPDQTRRFGEGDSGSVHLEFDGAVALITIDRVRKRNALDAATLAHFDSAVRVAGAACELRPGGPDGSPRQTVRCVVLTGAGGHFSAGADLDTAEDTSFVAELRATLDRLAGLAVPTIAAISGSCIGLGMQLALSCDLRVATDDALFAVPVARLGLMVDEPTLRRLVLAVGWGRARALLLAAERVGPDELAAAGFLQRRGDLDDALSWAASIAELAPIAQRAAKVGLDLAELGMMADLESREAFGEMFEVAWASDDLREGRSAFGEKRTPKFRGS